LIADDVWIGGAIIEIIIGTHVDQVNLFVPAVFTPKRELPAVGTEGGVASIGSRAKIGQPAVRGLLNRRCLEDVGGTETTCAGTVI
jgi:hypothetical protein